ncbi:hypothetical protein GCM10011584_06200 [Nocardioides phosphati]|uniref:Sigma-70 family RNA polymerase sigma factor n=1 Tax=Nocardioides phosphati TaxID=1867775 RepID=A0ABQ2N7U3_9ACTN|nr:sigma-70 family RNA polymerase sigma factor [Nocardioides phosphati]GGO85680.1 hypothetical protein GCM10011584_06200 [Nocardioides phosphati]
MTDTLTLQETGDAELISAVRGGDVSAYGPLFERHVEAARRLARQLVGAADADDLVSDAFAKVLRVLQGGGGPDVAFRAYLLTSIRRLHVDKIRATSRLHSTDDMEAFDPGVPFRDTAVEGFESAAAAKAFASLPERWQAVLWHTEVEGQKPAEVAALLGMTPNSVSALAYRAREGLRQAFLNSHAMDVDDDACAWTHQHLGGYIRNGISKRDAGKVEKHIDECRKCMAIYLELTEVNNNLAAILAPLLLGSAGLGYLASAGVATKGGLLLLVDRIKDGIGSNGPAAAATGVVAAGVIAASAVFALQAGGDHTTPPRADGPPPATASATPPATSDAPTTTPTSAPPTSSPTTSAPTSSVPTATTTPTATTAPTATPTPTKTPTQAPPPPPTSDVTITAGAVTAPDASGTSTVDISVSGIPAGQSVAVTWSEPTTASPRVAARRYLAATTTTATPGLEVSCSDGNCTLTKARPTLTLTATVTDDRPHDLTISLVPSAGIHDPDLSDNSTTIHLEPAPSFDAAITRGDVTPANDNNGRFGDYDVAFHITGLKPLGSATISLAAQDLDVVSTTGSEVTCTDTTCAVIDTGDGTADLVVRVRVDRLLALVPGLDLTLGGFDFNEAGGTNNTAGWHPLLEVGGGLILL